MSRRKDFRVLHVALPLTPVYYFEQTDRSTRLSYYIPRAKLRQMILAQRVKDDILLDYPDGVEIDVSEIQFAEFERRYHYINEFTPSSIWRAFETLLEQTRDRNVFRGCAYINATVVERLATIIDRFLRDASDARSSRPRDAEEVASDAHEQLRILQNSKARRRVMQLLKREHLPRIDMKLPIDRQPWSDVRVSKGVSPLELFVRAQQGQKGEAHGNHG